MFARFVLFFIVVTCLFSVFGSNVRSIWSIAPKTQPALLCSRNTNFTFFETDAKAKEPKLKRKYSKTFNKVSLKTDPNAFTSQRKKKKPLDFKLFGIF